MGVYSSRTPTPADEIIVVDGMNHPIYAPISAARLINADGAPTACARTVFDQIVSEARQARTMAICAQRDRKPSGESQSHYNALLGASFGRWAGHIMSVDGEPAVVAAISIVPNLDPDFARRSAAPAAQHCPHRRNLHGRCRLHRF